MLDSGDTFVNAVVVHGSKVKCQHCELTGHVGRRCWHFNPLLASQGWVPRSEKGYTL